MLVAPSRRRGLAFPPAPTEPNRRLRVSLWFWGDGNYRYSFPNQEAPAAIRGWVRTRGLSSYPAVVMARCNRASHGLPFFAPKSCCYLPFSVFCFEAYATFPARNKHNARTSHALRRAQSPRLGHGVSLHHCIECRWRDVNISGGSLPADKPRCESRWQCLLVCHDLPAVRLEEDPDAGD